VRVRVGEYANGSWNLAPEQILHGERATPVGKVDKLEACGASQRDAEEMWARASAGRAIGGELGIRTAPVDELRQRRHVRGHHRSNCEQKWEGADRHNRNEVLERFVVELLIDMLATGEFLTMIPGSVLRFGPDRAAIKVLALTTPRWRFPTCVLTLKNRTLTPLAQRFIELCA
jgi:DNA-binding transcriptional LysR family regulator